MDGALAGIKVIEAASYVTGPFASQLLADLGADVIKVEEPQARRSVSRLGRAQLLVDVLQSQPQQEKRYGRFSYR